MNKTIIFDFDGTLADTLSAAVDIYNEIAPKYKCKTVSADEVQQLRSLTPNEVISKLNIDMVKLPILLAIGKRKLKIGEIKPFDDIIEVIKKLHEQGNMIGILTSNSKRNIRKFLRKNKIQHYFSFITSSPKIFGKSIVLHNIMKKYKLKTDEIFYVGDETRDIEACKLSKIPIISVSWGFNTREALEKLEPKYIIDSPSELLSIIK